MANKKQPLKRRGLSDLLDENTFDLEVQDGEKIVDIELKNIITNEEQPRKSFDEDKIKELAISIKENGIFQPIIVKQVGKRYMIIAGERRYRAAKSINLQTIPCVIRKYTDSQVLQISLLENLQRENLNIIEEANAYKKILEFDNISQNELADRIGKSRSHITNVIGILNLKEDFINKIIDNNVSMGHARALSKLQDEKLIEILLNKVINEGLSVRKLEELIKDNKKEKEVIKDTKSNVVNNYKDIINSLSNKYNCKFLIVDDKISIKGNKKDIEVILEKLK